METLAIGVQEWLPEVFFGWQGVAVQVHISRCWNRALVTSNDGHCEIPKPLPVGMRDVFDPTDVP